MPSFGQFQISVEPSSSYSSHEEESLSWHSDTEEESLAYITDDALLSVSEPSDCEWEELMMDNQDLYEGEGDETMRMREREEQERTEMGWVVLAQQETRENSVIVFPARDVLVVRKEFLNPSFSWVLPKLLR